MTYLLLTCLVILFILLCLLIRKHFVCKYKRKTFQRLIGHTNIGYCKYRCRDGVILALNKGFIEILELRNKTEKDVIGHPLSEFFIYVEGEESIRERLRLSKELRNYQYRFKTLEGKDKYVLHNSYIEKDPFTKEEVIEALVQDVTDEKLSYEKMREAEERYEKLFKNSGDMVIICRREGLLIEEINPITEVITEFSEGELLGMPLEKLISPRSKKELRTVQQDLLFRGTARLETEILCRKGNLKQVIMTLSAVNIEDNDVVLAVAKDISEFIAEREGQEERKKELENFWKTSVEREERIRDLRIEVEALKKTNKTLKEGHVAGHEKK